MIEEAERPIASLASGLIAAADRLACAQEQAAAVLAAPVSQPTAERVALRAALEMLRAQTVALEGLIRQQQEVFRALDGLRAALGLSLSPRRRGLEGWIN
jgi:hypothetical protein